MTSIGNDIIDLNFVDKNRTTQSRFYSKFITPAELLIERDVSFANFVWLLWSIKESVFKFVSRHEPHTFSPAKIIVQQIIEVPASSADFFEMYGYNPMAALFYRGVARFKQTDYCFQSVICQHLIATIVNDDDFFNDIECGISQVEGSSHAEQSAAVRQLLLHRLSELYPYKTFQITKSTSGCPLLITDGNEDQSVVSLAHHGNFVAFSLKIAKRYN